MAETGLLLLVCGTADVAGPASLAERRVNRFQRATELKLTYY